MIDFFRELAGWLVGAFALIFAGYSWNENIKKEIRIWKRLNEFEVT